MFYGDAVANNELTDDELVELARTAIKKIKSYVQPTIEAKTGDYIEPKIVWKLRGLLNCLAYRSVKLSDGVMLSYDNGNKLCAIVLIRQVIETYALLHSLEKKIEDVLKSKDYASLDDLVMNLTFGDFPSLSDAIAKPQILNHIDKAKVTIDNIRELYDILSCIVHPNHRGVFGGFSIIDRENYSTVMLEDLHPVMFNYFYASVPFICFSENSVKKIHGNLEHLAEICP